jgi:hypothetical protein
MMETYQFYSLLGTLLGLLFSIFVWLIANLRTLDKRLGSLELEIAVLKAIAVERGK